MNNQKNFVELEIEDVLKHSPVDWDQVLLKIVSAYGCTAGTIHFFDKRKKLLKLQAYTAIPSFILLKMKEIPMGKGMAGIAAERLEPVEICNLQTDESGVARPAAKTTKVEGSIAVPMLLEGELYGVLGIAKSIPYNFSKEEIDGLLQIGERLSRNLVSNDFHKDFTN